MNLKTKKQEQGIVLLSCLIFLLLLLSLLRFTLTSASMEEMKAGADYDQMRASEAAAIAMRDAEYDIKRMSNPSSGKSVSLEDANETDAGKQMALAIAYWSDPSKFANRSGVYDGDAEQVCGDKPSYTCLLDWGDTDGKPDCSKLVCFGNQSNSTTLSNEQGAYIIERFKGDGATLGLSDAHDKDAIVLRVTAVGYSMADGNAARSKAVLQNTYLLTGE